MIKDSNTPKTDIYFKVKNAEALVTVKNKLTMERTPTKNEILV